MKKSVILFAVACAAYGATLLAAGIYLLQFDLAAVFAEMLVEKASIVGAILVFILYIPIILLRYSCYFLIIFGAGYILFFARTLYKLYKGNVPWLYKNLRIINFSHCCLFILIFIADLIILPYIFKNINNGVSAALTVFTALINATAIALAAVNFFALKKLKQNMTAESLTYNPTIPDNQ